MSQEPRLTLTLSERPGADLGDLDELHAEINDSVWDLVYRYVSSGSCAMIWDDYIAETTRDGEHLSRDGLTLVFRFPERGGDRRRSARVARWWFRLGLATSRDSVDELVSDAGVVVAGRRESVAEALADVAAPRIIDTGNELLLVGERDGAAVLEGDGEERAPSADEARRVAAIAAGEATPVAEDPVSQMLAPSDEFASAMREAVAGDSPEVAETALWYLGNTAAPDAETVAAIFSAAGASDDSVADAARQALARLARHASIADATRARLYSPEPGERAAAVAILPELQERELVGVTEVGDALLAGLEAQPPVLDAAATAIGYATLEAYRGRAVRALCQLLEAGRGGAEAAHGAVLSLVNMHLGSRVIGTEVRAAFEREAKSEREHASLAEWALQIFSSPAGS